MSATLRKAIEALLDAVHENEPRGVVLLAAACVRTALASPAGGEGFDAGALIEELLDASHCVEMASRLEVPDARVRFKRAREAMVRALDGASSPRSAGRQGGNA